MKVLKFIVSLFSAKQLYSIISPSLSCLREFLQYKKADLQTKKEEKEEKKQQEYDDKVEDVVENGDVQDLLNLRK